MRPPDLFRDPERAWEPYVPGPEAPWDEARVAHLHRRAGFGATWGQVRRDVAEGYEATLRRVLDGEEKGPDGRPSAEFERIAAVMEDSARRRPSIERVQATWLFRLIFTPTPLVERLTLAWHGHYASSNEKVRNPQSMLEQNRVQRALGRGRIGALHRAMLRDPALLHWLDGLQNRKEHPNENLAREFLELFALGEGHYSERDVRETARALSGWRELGNLDSDRHLAIDPADHDAGEKTILGATGPWGVEDVVRIVSGRPDAARHVARRLYRTFVSDTDEPGIDLIEPMARAMRGVDDNDVDVGRGVELILRSRLFHSADCRGRRVKGPVDYVVGVLRAIEAFDPPPDLVDLEIQLTRMGQRLFYPPGVSGWPDGLSWLRGPALLARANFVAALAETSLAPARLRALARRHNLDEKGWTEAFATLLLGTPSPGAGDLGTTARELLMMPEAQLC